MGQKARNAARKADELKRKLEREADEKKRNASAMTLMEIPDDITAQAKLALCRREYVDEKQCDAWVADQQARNAARMADELKRKLESEADEKKRNASALTLMEI